MAATVTVSGAFNIADYVAIDAFITSALGGAAGDAMTSWRDDAGGGVWIACSKA